MLEGKTYTIILRALLLLDCALHHIMVKPYIEREADTDRPSAVEDTCINNEAMDEDSVLSSKYDDNNNTQQTELEWDDLINELKVVYESLMAKCMSLEDAAHTPQMKHLSNIMEKMHIAVKSRRTSKLLLNLCKCIGIARRFVQAEHVRNWNLHLYASQQMLPFLAAAGHNNYTKYIRYYLQCCNNLCKCLKEPFNDIKFTVCRNEANNWCGTFTDQTIEVGRHKVV